MSIESSFVSPAISTDHPEPVIVIFVESASKRWITIVPGLAPASGKEITNNSIFSFSL